jgi:hypothetical protein
VADAPPRSEPSGLPSVTLLGRHQGRDGHQVVRIGRVAQTEEKGDTERDEKRGAVEEARQQGVDFLDRLEEELEVHRAVASLTWWVAGSRLAHSAQSPMIGKWVKLAS